MYNIKQAAARAGVSVPVLRAWERRYGIVSPERSSSGYRRFDDESVARVRTMRSLIDDGWSPSAAAAAILAGEIPVTPAGGVQDDRPDDAGAIAAAAPDIASRFVDAARDLDASALEQVLDDLFARGSFERIVGDLLFPSLRRLGDAWAAHEISVAAEHLASAAVLRRLGFALEAAGTARAARPRVIVGLPPGGRHELGALAFAVAARRAGLTVDYLGPDLPIDDWVVAAIGADAAVIGVVTARDRRAATEVAAALHAAQPGLVVAFGGVAAPTDHRGLRLASGLREAVAELREALPASAA